MLSQSGRLLNPRNFAKEFLKSWMEQFSVSTLPHGRKAPPFRRHPVRCRREFTGWREAQVPNQWPARNALTDLFAPRLQVLLHQSHELVGDGSVDQAVVVA